MSGIMAADFDDRALGAQDVFRSLLAAMAEPGLKTTPNRPLPASRPPMFPTSLALALTLVDADTPIWLDVDDVDLARDLRFHCGCTIIDEPADAAFGLLCDPENLSRLDEFALGSPEYPDRSTTLIVQVKALEQGTSYKLSGPGIQASRMLAIDGLPSTFPELWQANRRHLPQGVDLILTDGRSLVGLPRSTALEIN